MICSNCGKEFPDSGRKHCPRCGQPLGTQPGAAPVSAAPIHSISDGVRVIIARYGEAQFRDAGRTVGIFADLAPELTKEKELFRLFLQCGGAESLLKLKNASLQAQTAEVERLVRNLTDNHWIAEPAARQVCEEFMQGAVNPGWKPFSQSGAAPKPAISVPAPVNQGKQPIILNPHSATKTTVPPKKKKTATNSSGSTMKLLLTGGSLAVIAVLVFFLFGGGGSRDNSPETIRDNPPQSQSGQTGGNTGNSGNQDNASQNNRETQSSSDPSIERYEYAVQVCREWESQGDYASIFSYLTAVYYDWGDAWCSDLMIQYQSRYVSWVLTPVEEMMADNRHLEAIRTLYDARRVYDCVEFSDALIRIQRDIPRTAAIAAGRKHTAVLRTDGTVAAVGDNSYGQRNTAGWSDIISISSGDYHTVGLRSDGRVEAVGDNTYGQVNVYGWTDIIAIGAGDYHTVGLKSDGTLVVAGDDHNGKCDIQGLMNAAGNRKIVDIAVGYEHTLALLEDGTVVAVGRNDFGQCNVNHWTDVVAIYAGSEHSVGLKSDGTVVATGQNTQGQCDVYGWTDIIRLTCGDYFTAGIRSDGTVVFVGRNTHGEGNVAGLEDIAFIGGGTNHFVYIAATGKTRAKGSNGDGQCDVGGLYY